MKNQNIFWSVLGAIVVAAIIFYLIRKNKNSKLTTSTATASKTATSTIIADIVEKQKGGGCVKHVGRDGSVWYTYNQMEVSLADCIDKGKI